jgi:UDP-N-acetylmuramoylalanine--D-glutamate ligase
MTRSLAGERIGVVGLARSGLAAARLALARGASVYAADDADTPETRAAALQVEQAGGDAQVGGADVERLAACDRVVLSPGIPPSAAVVRELAGRGATLVPELEFAYEQLTGLIVAVTGTNGKSTTTALIAHLLQAAGRDARMGGNIGTALSEVALSEPQPEVMVVEASSFQLGQTRRFAPAIGVLTNLAPDHLDRYASVEEYYADKARLFQNGTLSSRWVLNGEDAAARELPGSAPGERYHFRIRTPLEEAERGGHVSPDGWLVLRVGRDEERLVPAGDLRILGPHNVANSLAAAVVARICDAPVEAIARGLRSFPALRHRLEPVAEKAGVLWINDSKATNLESTRVALRSLDRPAILLLGGRHKGEPYHRLLPDLEEHVKLVLAYGEAAEVIAGDLDGFVPVRRVDGTFEEVVRRAAETARAGDAVLLSPACSSYDMFHDFEERGDRFRALVEQVGA